MPLQCRQAGSSRRHRPSEEARCAPGTPTTTGSSSGTGSRSPTSRTAAATRTVVFAPIDPIVHSRVWKGQIPYLSRYARVVAIDPRGNGRSDRTTDSSLLTDLHFAADTVAVMDELEHRQGPAGRAVLERLDGPERRRRPPGPGARRGQHRDVGAVPDPARTAPRGDLRGTSSWTPTRGGPRTTSTTGGATTAGSPSSSSTSCCPSRTRPSSGRTPSRTPPRATSRSRSPSARRSRRCTRGRRPRRSCAG